MKLKIGTPTSQHFEYDVFEVLPTEIIENPTETDYDGCDATSEPYDNDERAMFYTITKIDADLSMHRAFVEGLAHYAENRIHKISGDDEWWDYYPQLCEFIVAYARAINEERQIIDFLTAAVEDEYATEPFFAHWQNYL